MEKTFQACETSVGLIAELFNKKLKEYQISDKIRQEYVLLIEEVATKVVSVADPGAEVTLTVKKHLGTVSAKLSCPGKAVRLERESGTDYAGRIIKEYSEYLRQSYSFGVNEIVFSTFSSSNEILFADVFAGVLALLLGLLFRALLSVDALSWIHRNLSVPIVSVFVRAMQTVAVPVAFFSLSYFVIKIRRTFDRNNKTMHLGFRYMLSSLVAVAIGVITSLCFVNCLPFPDLSTLKTEEHDFIGNLEQIVSSNIIEPFTISNPIPVLINALLIGLAASSVFGKTGDTIRHGIAAFNDLFSRMMNIIYSIIPVFLFFAVFDLLIQADKGKSRFLWFSLLTFFAALLLLCLYYVLRLIFGGVSVVEFFGKYSDLLVNNFKIASNIESFPYNKRYLAKKMSLSRDYLSEGLKLGTLLNMDGSSLVTSLVLMNMIAAVKIGVTPMQYVGLAVILLLFAVGAPNAPGSLLLGSILLMNFIGIGEDLIGIILILEALTSKCYSFINAAGDIVTLAVEDEKNKRKKTE